MCTFANSATRIHTTTYTVVLQQLFELFAIFFCDCVEKKGFCKSTLFRRERTYYIMEYMTVQEAAELWGYSESTIRGWCKDDKIILILHAEKVANRWRIPKKAQCPKPIKAGGQLK